MQDKIIAAIAAYLERETKDISTFNDIILCFGAKNPGHYTHARFCEEFAAEIAAAIAPLLEPKDYPYIELFEHMANEHGLRMTNTELGDIIHIARK